VTLLEVCRKHGASQQSFIFERRSMCGLGLNELRELRQLLGKENNKVQACSGTQPNSLDRHIIEEIVAKSSVASDA